MEKKMNHDLIPVPYRTAKACDLSKRGLRCLHERPFQEVVRQKHRQTVPAHSIHDAQSVDQTIRCENALAGVVRQSVGLSTRHRKCHSSDSMLEHPSFR